MPSVAFAGISVQLQRGAGDPAVYTKIGQVKKITRSGSKSDRDEITNFDSTGNFREYLPTLLDGGDLSVDMVWNPADATQQDFLDDFNGQVVSPWRIVLPGTYGTLDFDAFPSSDDFDLSPDKAGVKSAKLTITGPMTFTPGS